MDIISLPAEIDKTVIDGKFRLVTIVVQRAKELAFGAVPKIQTKSKKVVSIAIEEAMSGKLEFLTGEEAKKASMEAKKFDYKKYLESKRKESAPEDLTELEKDLKIYLHERESIDKDALEKLFTEKTEGSESSEDADSLTDEGTEK